MLSRTLPVRVAAEALFFACVFSGFYWEATGNYFCNEAGGMSRTRQTLHVAIILTAWDSFALIIGMALAHWLRDAAFKRAATLWLSAGIAAIGYFSAQFVLFPWNEEHHFHGLLDCSCFFTEGYGMMFPLMTAPILILATLVRESLTQKALGRKSIMPGQ